jgi:hypothetical protein
VCRVGSTGQKARGAAARNNLKQLGRGPHDYQDSYLLAVRVTYTDAMFSGPNSTAVVPAGK